MTSYNNSRIMLIVIMTIVMVMSIMTTYAFGSFLSGSYEDPYVESHEYVVTGSYCDINVSGTGVSTYDPESNKEYSHVIRTTVECPDGSQHSTSFMYFFTSDGPIDMYRYLGETVSENGTVKTWQYDISESMVTFVTDGDMRIIQYTVKGDSWDVVGTISPTPLGDLDRGSGC